jgi:hypothetical protein
MVSSASRPRTEILLASLLRVLLNDPGKIEGHTHPHTFDKAQIYQVTVLPRHVTVVSMELHGFAMSNVPR